MAGSHSFSHVGLSKELAMSNPELTLPMFCGKIVFELCMIIALLSCSLACV